MPKKCPQETLITAAKTFRSSATTKSHKAQKYCAFYPYETAILGAYCKTNNPMLPVLTITNTAHHPLVPYKHELPH